MSTKRYQTRISIKFIQFMSLFLFSLALMLPMSVEAIDGKSLPGNSCRSLSATPLTFFNTALVNSTSSTVQVVCPLVIDSISRPIRWVDVYVVDKSSQADVICRLYHGWRKSSSWSMWSNADVSSGNSSNRQRLDLNPSGNWGLSSIASAFVSCSLPANGSMIISVRWDED